MDVVRKIDKKIEGVFKDLPALPNSSRESLANIWPWVALVFGIIQLFAAWSLWRLMSVADDVSLRYGSFYVNYPDTISGSARFMAYLGIAVLLIDAVILLLAYTPLKKRERRGWDLLLLGALLNIGYSVVSLFIHNRGLGSFIFSLLGSAVGLYLLYQVKGKYGSVKSSSKND